MSFLKYTTRSLALRTARISVRHAATGTPATDPANTQRDTIRRMLYPPGVRNGASPNGTWRPDVARALQLVIPSVQAHKTVERAWKLYQRHLRKKRDEELGRKFECMRRAMQQLEEIDPVLFTEANRKEDPRSRSVVEMEVLKNCQTAGKKAIESRIRGLFPRELRVPADTPQKEGWTHKWKPFDRPL